MCPILDGYGMVTVFSFPYTPSCDPRLSACSRKLLRLLRAGAPRAPRRGGPRGGGGGPTSLCSLRLQADRRGSHEGVYGNEKTVTIP
jgi:hypothetical protein